MKVHTDKRNKILDPYIISMSTRLMLINVLQPNLRICHIVWYYYGSGWLQDIDDSETYDGLVYMDL